VRCTCPLLKVSRRKILLGGTTLAAASALTSVSSAQTAQAQQRPTAQAQPAPAPPGQRPNILVIFGDDIGQTNISAYSFGVMGYRTPNIDRIAREGMMFTDYYAEQSCTAGRSTFITGQSTLRTGLSKVGIPGASVDLQARDATIAELLKPLGYATGQFGKNHLGDKDEYLPTNHGFDEFFGNLYHLNAEEDPENRFIRKTPLSENDLARVGSLKRQRMEKLKTLVRSPRSECRRLTTKRRPLPSTLCSVKSAPTGHSSAGSIPPACTSERMCESPIGTNRD
jgi:arylsulfatase